MYTLVFKRLAVLTLFPLISFTGSDLVAQATYSITDLGVVSGRTFSTAVGLNDNGQVVGRSSGGTTGGSVGFLWDSTNGMVGLQGFRTTNDSNEAFGINNLGQIVGTSYRDAGAEHAIVWDTDGTKIDLGDLPGGNDNSFGRAINDSGQATGLGITSTARRAFLWDAVNGISDPVGDLPGGIDETFGRAINNAGQIAGNSSADTGPRAFLWDSTDGLTNLGDLAGGEDYSFAQGLNDVGDVVGFGKIDSGRRAFIWNETDGMIDLGYAFFATEENMANDINDDGVVVGTVLGNVGTFIWEDEYGMVNLNDLLDASGAGWDLQAANAINNSGQIVGWGVNPSGASHAFLLTPYAVPEPGSCVLLSLLSVAGLARRRRATSCQNTKLD